MISGLIFRTTLFRVYEYVTELATPVRIQQHSYNMILGHSFFHFCLHFGLSF